MPWLRDCGWLAGWLTAGVDDDKMGCLQAIHAAEAFLTVASALPINIK